MEFSKRQGTENPGLDYEIEIAALLSIRYSFEESVEDFWIDTNVAYVGDTDDVVLCITQKSGEKMAFLLQLKHENSVKGTNNFRDKDFTYDKDEKKRNKTKDKFSLNKYFIGYEEFQNNLKKNVEDQPQIIKALSAVNKFSYVLYTNRGVEKKLKSLVDTNENVFFKHLNTSSNLKNYCYGFDDKVFFEFDKEFIQNIYLFPNQTNLSGVFNLIKTEIQKFFGLHTFSHVNFDDVTDRYLKIIKLWTKGCEFDNVRKYITLSKRDVINILSDILLKPYKCDIEDNKFSYYDCPQKNIWNKFMLLKDISIVYGNDLTVQFLKDYIGSEVKLYIKNQGRYDYWKADVAKLASASNAFCEPISDDQIQMIKICGNTDNDCISIISVYKLMWFYKSLPLLLEIEDKEEYNDIIKILKISKNELKVIIITNDEDFQCQKIKHVNLFSSLNDLAPSEQLEILNLPVRFQGRISVPLSEITKKSMLEYLKCQDIIQILCNDFNVGNKFEFNCECYINRNMLKILIDFRALVKIKTELFLIEVINREQCEKILKEKLTSIDVKVNTIPLNICILESNSIPENIEKLKKAHANFHRLLFYEDFLEWKESTGSVENISNFRLFDNKYRSNMLFDDVSEFLHRVDSNKLHIISGYPGMGKSVLLNYIEHYSRSRLWILPVILRKIFEKNKIKEPSEFFLFYLDEFLRKDSSVQNIEFSSKIFMDMVESERMLLLLDGFDEISFFHEEQFSNLIVYLYNKKHHSVITSRENKASFLENKYKVLSVHFKSLTLDDQKQYLTSFFKLKAPFENESSNTILPDFVEQLLDAVKHNLSDRDQEFTGIPLQLQLLAKYFLEEYKMSINNSTVLLSKKFNLLDLYDKFITSKTDILCQKYGPSEEQWLELLKTEQHLLAVQYIFEYEVLTDLHIKNSLTQYCVQTELKAQLLQKDGILVAKSMKNKIVIDFVHRTFAEYMAAKWLAQNVKNFKETIARLVKIALKSYDNYKFLLVIFNSSLATHCPFHLDIINVKVDAIKLKIELNPNIFVQTDEINRTVFHLFALYASDYKQEDLKEIFSNNLLKSLTLDTLDNLNSFSPLDYALYGKSWALANKLCQLSRYMRINDCESHCISFLQKGFNKEYSSLYLTILHNHLCQELLLGRIQESTIMWPYIINVFCRQFNILRWIRVFKFIEKEYLTVGEYLKFCKIKDTTKYYYHDIRFAIAFGSKSNVLDLLLTKELDINENDFSNNNTLLHYATIYKRPDIIEILLEKGADVNISGKDGYTVAHYAAEGGCNNILELYIDIGVDLDRKDESSGYTPLDLAISWKNLHVALTLLRHNAKISDSVLFDIHTVLHNVVEFGNVELLQGLIKRGCDVNAKLFFSGYTMLHAALASNHVDMAKILIKNNCDFKSDSASDSLLYLTAKTGDLELLNLFLSSGLSVNKGNHIGETPLMIAIKNDHVEFSKVLISNNADVFAESKYEDVFTLAIRKGNNEIVSLLMKKGCDVNKRDHNGDTPLLIALHENKLNIVNLLLQNNADVVYAQNNFGYTTLHCSAMYGYKNLVTTFLEYGVDINKRTKDFNDTALLLALQNKWIEVSKLLLLSIPKPKVNVVNRQKCNALHYAAQFGDVTLVEDLIAAGAEINLQNDIGLTPLEMAVLKKKSDIAKLLLSPKGVVLKKIYKKYPFLLHIAASVGNDEIITFCLEQKFDINEQDDQCMTPLLCALVNKKFETAILLIENGGDISLKCKKQQQALHYAFKDFNDSALSLALKYNYMEVAKLLLLKVPDVNVKNNKKCNSLHYVDEFGVIALVQDLISAGAEINLQNDFGLTSLEMALLNTNSDIFKSLLFCEGDAPFIVNKKYPFLLHIFASAGSNVIIRLCLEKEFDINKQDYQGMTPLLYALKNENFETAKLLIENGADTISKCKMQHWPLHYAARIGYDDLLNDILEKGFDIHEINSLGETALCTALLNGNISTAKLLCLKGAEIHIKMPDRSTTVHLAASCGYNELIMECIDKGYEINSLNFNIDLPIDCAIKNNKFDTVKLLIVSGAIPSLLTLQLYVNMKVQSDLEVDEKIRYFKLLLENFGNINLKDKVGNTILHYICCHPHENELDYGKRFYLVAVEILVGLGANFEINNKDYKSAYNLAVENNLENIVLIFNHNLSK